MNSLSLQYDLHWVLGEQELGTQELSFAKALTKNGRKTTYININSLYSGNLKSLNRYSHRLPRKYDNLIHHKYLERINLGLQKKYEEEKPACIFIYNDCKVLPETINSFRRHGTRIIVFLGDDPNYLFAGKKTFLLTALSADAIITPDTGWIEGLQMLDARKIIYSPYGSDPEIFHPINPSPEQIKKYSADILFIGTGYYLNSWGIRRAAILNELAGMNLKIFGDNLWHELFPYFPMLKKHFINEPLRAGDVNAACSCARIYPVVVNSGVVNGASTRIFDGISSGIFVLAEYRKDLEKLFPGGELVFFRSKSELRKKAEYYLKHEDEMKDHVRQCSEIVTKNYSFELCIKNILEQI